MANIISKLCACIGPAFNEPLCSCKMVNQGIERSDEYKEYMLPENVEKRRIISSGILDTLLSKDILRVANNERKKLKN